MVIIGTVIKGDTGHDEIVAHAAARAAADLALQFDKPVATRDDRARDDPRTGVRPYRQRA